MRYWVILLLTFGTLMSFSCGEQQKPIRLVADQITPKIVLHLGAFQSADDAITTIDQLNWLDPEKQGAAVATNALAALELRDYLMKLYDLSPSDIPIVSDRDRAGGPLIFIGMPSTENAYRDLARQIASRWKKSKTEHDQAFRFDTFSEKEQSYLVISSERPIGTLYGVYEFLNRLGVEWYSPGEMGEFVPQGDSLIVQPMSELYVPPYRWRGFYREFDAQTITTLSPDPQEKIDKSFYRWMGRNRLNGIWQSEDSPELKFYGIQTYCGASPPLMTLLSPKQSYPYNHPQFEGDEANPLDAYEISKFYQGDFNQNGTLEYFEAHPEWFPASLDSNLKLANSACFCPSQKQAMEEFIKLLLENLHRGSWRFADKLVLDADSVPFCACPECEQIGNRADKVFYLLDHIHHALELAFDSGRLNRKVFLVAVYPLAEPLPTKKPNRSSDFKATALLLSADGRCLAHTIDDPRCTEANAALWEQLQKWQDQKPFKGEFYLLQPFNARRYRDLPLVLNTLMSAEGKILSERGIQGVLYKNARTSDLGVHRLLNYQFAKQSWNPSADQDSLFQNYLAHCYPSLSGLMKEYYIRLQVALSNIESWRAELTDKVNHIVLDEKDMQLLPLEKFAAHFNIELQRSSNNSGIDWENTYQLVHDLRYILDTGLGEEMSDVTLERLLEDEYQLRYAELMVGLYDKVILILTLGEEEPEMLQEAVIRLRQLATQLRNYEIRSPALGMKNGLQASGLEDAVAKLLEKFDIDYTEFDDDNAY